MEARQDFLSLLRRRNWKEKDLRILKGIFLGKLSKVNVSPDIFEFAVREALKGDLTLSSKVLGVEEIDVLEILFWFSPKKYPFPSEKLKQKIKAKSVKEFMEKADSLRVRLGKRDFLELYLYLEGVEEKETKKPEEKTDLLVRLKRLSLERLNEKEIDELRFLYGILDPLEKNRVRSADVHPYLVAALMRKPYAPIVIDGSNLLWRGNLHVSFIDEIFEKLAFFREYFFPYKIVFDKNVEYILPISEKKEFERWKNSSNVLFESPADDLIISLATSMNAVILSGDRFKEYDLSKRIRVITPEEIEKG
ncbi:hypothetical protein [Thermotoga sp. KOL6]|uniref:NYN domain-containing protein n=1 Tax=Thermotoga sp. KOL6 TaxID=126741 RepID=UPI001E29F2C8|nr:hypothetical protein [Thermotoga sp. KOL6]